MQDELSEREKQVAAHLAAGQRVAGVARELCIAEITVRNHLRNIFSKLDVHSQGELIERIRKQPELLGSHRSIPGLDELGQRGLLDELEAVNRATVARLDEVFASKAGKQAMKAALRAVLPFDEERRREWRTRLAIQALADEQRDVREAFGEQRRQWLSRQMQRIPALQDMGWVRGDLDPDDVRRQLFGAVYAAVLALLADPSRDEQERQLVALDALLDSIAEVKTR